MSKVTLCYLQVTLVVVDLPMHDLYVLWQIHPDLGGVIASRALVRGRTRAVHRRHVRTALGFSGEADLTDLAEDPG